MVSTFIFLINKKLYIFLNLYLYARITKFFPLLKYTKKNPLIKALQLFIKSLFVLSILTSKCNDKEVI